MNRILEHGKFILAALWLTAFPGTLCAAEPPRVSFEPKDGQLRITIGQRPFGTYVWKDEQIHRPYFCYLYSPRGVQVTRNHPPIEGQDSMDHADFHPGLWLSFGDLSGSDFWRNQARTGFAEFVQPPRGSAGRGEFAVQNHYLANDQKLVCQEICHYTIMVRPAGYYLLIQSRFTCDQEFAFGDQEEMGLGVRVNTAMAVQKGGQILNSDGLINEKEVWGRTASWCDYSGMVDGVPVGVTLMPAPGNFRPSWFHARDYGLLAANPFGRNAFTQLEKSRVNVAPGTEFQLAFGVFIHDTTPLDHSALDAAYQEFLSFIKY
ncbi:MAG: DUF6807 family protein [bacterium]